MKKGLKTTTELVFAPPGAPQPPSCPQAAAEPGAMHLSTRTKKENAVDSELVKGASLLFAEKS